MNRLCLTGAFPGDCLLGFGDLLVDPAQTPPGPVVAVVVIDDLIPPPGGGGRPRLGEYLPVADLLARVLAPPLGDHVGDVPDPHAQDERQARSLRSPSGSPPTPCPRPPRP